MTETDRCLCITNAIYSRRTVRNFTPRKPDADTIRKLLDAAVHAPTAMHLEPWAFAVIQDTETLKRLSEAGKEKLKADAVNFPPEKAKALLEKFSDPNSSLFYNANTLIVIYGKPMGPFVEADCWLAAENLMLAACSMGLGTCVIGLAVPALNAPEWKKEMNVPEDVNAYVAIILGEPEGEVPPKPRKAPEILAWK